MKDITYFFGAGASCQAMPLVNNFNKRFSIFQNFMSNQFTFTEIGTDSIAFANEIKAHSTFDTFFKKLFHQNKNEEIQKFKTVLLFYFLFEHLFTYDELGYDEDFVIENNKNYKIDPRYEALIAGLLKPIKGKIDFYKNVNFLTWNYDANLLNALRNFISPEKPLNGFISEKFKDGYFNVNDQINVFHLNGHVAHPILNEIDSQDPNKIDNFINVLKNYGKPELKPFIDNIKFAWEQDVGSFENLSKKISSSNKIICIGYSFPLFNRIFDSHIFNDKNLEGQQLYIQNLETESVRNILASDLNILTETGSKSEPSVTYSTNCNSFLIPNDIFS